MSWATSRIPASAALAVESSVNDAAAMLNEDAMISQEEAKYMNQVAEESRKGDVYRRLMSSMKSFNSITADDITGLFNMTVVLLALYLGLTITFFAIYGAVDTTSAEVQLTYLSFTGRSIQINKAFVLNPTLAAAIACLLPTLGAFIDIVTWRGLKATSISCRTNWVRWAVDSLFTPCLTVITFAVLGFNDITTLIFQFIVVHVAIVSGGLTELVNSPYMMNARKYSVTWWTTVFAVWVGLSGVLPSLIVLARSSDLNDLPKLLLAAFSLLLAGWLLQWFLQVSYFLWLANPSGSVWFARDKGPVSNYIRYESMLAIANTLIRITVAVLVAFAYSGIDKNSGWVAEHRCFNVFADSLFDAFNSQFPLGLSTCESTLVGSFRNVNRAPYNFTSFVPK